MKTPTFYSSIEAISSWRVLEKKLVINVSVGCLAKYVSPAKENVTRRRNVFSDSNSGEVSEMVLRPQAPMCLEYAHY